MIKKVAYLVSFYEEYDQSRQLVMKKIVLTKRKAKSLTDSWNYLPLHTAKYEEIERG